ncbi:helix-turn-helix domain-containing protein [Novosphingobium sp.]|uniref:helix-turn-helix domain-containing protein n=1 Tax=Novosphingobium sp. TaxID=1874826 RepID=UPI0035B14686
MAAVWELDIPTTPKMVLLCLCDHARDDGTCWPSVPRIATRCSLTDRAVRNSLKWLREHGVITIQARSGHRNTFVVLPGTSFTPEPDSALNKVPQPRNIVPAPPEPDSGKPSMNHKKQSGRPTSAMSLPEDWWPAEFAAGTNARAVVDGWSRDELQRQVERFRAYNEKKGVQRTDWQHTWQAWVNKSVEFARTSSTSPRHVPECDVVAFARLIQNRSVTPN